MSSNWEADVREFMVKVAGQTVPTAPTLEGYPFTLRVDLLREEVQEFADAALRLRPVEYPTADDSHDHVPDWPEMIDAIVDIIYVAIGAAAQMGISLSDYWDEVHRSNMAKAAGRLNDRGKKLKPPGWTPPDIAGILAKQIAAEAPTGIYRRTADGSYERVGGEE